MGSFSTTSVKGEKIPLPQELITFYGQRGIFDSDLPSYEQIRGKNANEPPREGLRDKCGDPLSSTALVENKDLDVKYTEKLISRAKKIYRLLSGEKSIQPVEVLSRHYMINGGTKPIRLSYLVSGKSTAIYVKKPDLLRVLGKDVYNRLSSNTPLDFKFNEYVLVVKEAEGRLVTHANKQYYTNNEKFLDNLVRLSVLDDFMSINDLSHHSSHRNFLVEDTGKINVIDFDSLLSNSNFGNSVVDYFRFFFGAHLLDKRVNEVVKDEKIRIRRRFEDQSNYLEKLIKMMSKIKGLNKRVKENYGDKSVEYYFERQLSKCER